MKHKLVVTEAIAHQGKSMLFRELTAVFEAAVQIPPGKLVAGSLTKLGIEKVIERHTGLKTAVKVNMSPQPNAWVIPPVIDVNNPVVDEFRREMDIIQDMASEKFGQFFEGSNFKVGSIDLKNSRVTGVFTKAVSPIEVTKGLLTHQKFNPAMIAAVVLHEIGHIFTYLEFLGRTLTFNGALMAASERFMRADTREDKLKIIRQLDDAFDVTTEDPETLASTRSKETMVAVYARNYLTEKRHSALGSSIYDITLWESLADQFAMRHGVGKEGVAAIYEISRSIFHPSYQSYLTHIVMTILKVALFFLFLVAGSGMFIMILFINPAKKIYDDPRARMDRMRNDLVAGLKSSWLTPEQKKDILDDIKAVDEMIATVKDKRGLIELFYTAVLPSGRKQYSQRAFQLEMEKLVANNLIAASTRLQLLA